MPRVSFAFFIAAVLYGLVGMSMGMFMGASHDVRLAPVHVHTNLLGWVSLSLMGAFYALAREHAPRRLAWTSFVLLNLGILVSMPLLGVFLLSGNQGVLPILVLGEAAILAAMLSFGLNILDAARRTTVVTMTS
jgi:cbb3-type cytochrome oxidase subunit 1